MNEYSEHQPAPDAAPERKGPLQDATDKFDQTLTAALEAHADQIAVVPSTHSTEPDMIAEELVLYGPSGKANDKILIGTHAHKAGTPPDWGYVRVVDYRKDGVAGRMSRRPGEQPLFMSEGQGDLQHASALAATQAWQLDRMDFLVKRGITERQKKGETALRRNLRFIAGAFRAARADIKKGRQEGFIPNK